MKKFVNSILVSSLMVSTLFGFDKLLSKQELNNVLKSSIIYPRLSQDIKKGIVKARGVFKDGFYIINLKTPRGSGNIYITKDKKYTILGNIINNQNGSPLTAHFPINKEIVKKGVMFTFGKGKKEIYLVTDPQCPFCRMMEAKTKDYLAKNYKVHVILFPLPFHKYAKPMSYYILAAKNDKEKAKRLQETLAGSNAWKNYHPTKEEKAKFDQELENSKKAVEELGARGTPSVYDSNFNQINWTKLGVKK